MRDAWGITDRESALEIIGSLYSGRHHPRYIAENPNSPWGETGILGWDLGWLAQVASQSFLAGFISYNEFIELTIPAALILQEHFDSWEQFGENFVHGAAFWLRGNPNAESELAFRSQAQEVFVNYHIETLPPWDLDLSWVMEEF